MDILSTKLRGVTPFVKGKVWKILSLVRKDLIYTFTLKDGSAFDYPLNSVVGCNLFTGSFELTEIDWFCTMLRKGDIVFDIGANGGLYTILASKIVGETGHVYAFEPGSKELALLKDNIIKNNLSNVTIVPKAVSTERSTAKFAVSRDGAMSSLAKNEHGNQVIEEWVTVETVSLDEFVQELNIEKVDFIKIDVEGAEHLVFEGMQKILSSSSQPTILFESGNATAAGFNYSVSDFLGGLKAKGLLINFIDKNLNLVDIDLVTTNELGNSIYNFVAQQTIVRPLK
jgi:FkbM family methyltransferase